AFLLFHAQFLYSLQFYFKGNGLFQLITLQYLHQPALSVRLMLMLGKYDHQFHHLIPITASYCSFFPVNFSTASINLSPRTSKLGNWSQLALAGERRMTSPGSLSFHASGTAVIAFSLSITGTPA